MRINPTFYIINPIRILLLLLLSAPVLQGQEQINGVVNLYSKVTQIGAGFVRINPAQAGQYSAGDYVLLIQMQGVGIRTVQDFYGQSIQQIFGTPGGYELLIVQAVDGGTGTVTFTRNVYINSYDVAGNVQLIRVPFYNSPVVTSALTAPPWNSATGTGGVVAIMAGGKLTLNADIDVSGLGFEGAAGANGIGQCININLAANGLDTYPLSWNNAGLKGEGVAIHDDARVLLYPANAKGQGPNYSGGGGGNGRYSGGGGGSNQARGADGELENSADCGNDPRDGGKGGMNIRGTVIQNGIFAGGGGGASTGAMGSTASAGGNGGGIIIIIADTIDGNNHNIRSNGVTAANAAGDAGGGGGGAGGSVAVFARVYATPLRLSARGGNGGISPSPEGNGGGGGGGGGLLWFSQSSLPAAISSRRVSSGVPSPTNEADSIGEIKFNYSPNLNGFLFNSVWSETTISRSDSVCSDVMYGQLAGTRPVGGIPPYTYQWQLSTTSATTGFSAAPGINNLPTYTPPANLTQNTWYRRVVTDNGATITDVSLPVFVEVHPFILNNVIGDQDTICSGQDPALLGSRLTLQAGNGIYSYDWQTSIDNVNYSDVAVATESYRPPAGLTQTTWYRRRVTSGSCVNTSAPVRITVLPTVSNNNIITAPQEICDGMLFENLSASVSPVLTGGDNTYRFRWERSPDATQWFTAAGTINQPVYNPDENSSSFPGQEYYRRVVMSGSNDVCVSQSQPVLLVKYPVLTNNSLLPAIQATCSGTVPVQLTGSQPANGKGAGSYTYTWQDSTKLHTWSDVPGYTAVTSLDFSPPVLSDTTRYRRIVYSSACINISTPVTVNVHKPVTGNTISLLSGPLTDTTLCENSTPHRLTGTAVSGGTGVAGDYTFRWSSSEDNSAWTEITVAGSGSSYQPPSLMTTTWFRRRTTSGACVSESNPVKITVLPLIKDNTIAGNQIVCRDDMPGALIQAAGVNLSGGAGSGSYSYFWEESVSGTDWLPATGINNSPGGTCQPPVMTMPMLYRRNVISGPQNCCTSVSNVVGLEIDSLPPGSVINAGPDTIINSFDRITQMAAVPPITGGTGMWSLVEGSGSFTSDDLYNTKVTGLSPGLNRYLWKVTKGACSVEDMVDVIVYELVIPEGFSPNDDPGGYNNTFEIKGLDLPNQVAELTIINGAGTEVFSTTNRNGGDWRAWDGKNSKGIDLPEGTYYYLLRLISKGNGSVFKKSGFIVLKRY